MTISFRTRLFGLATLVVAVVLSVVLVLGWQGLLRNEVERLEDRLCLEARRVATQPQLGLDRSRLAADLRLRLRLGDSDDLAVRLEPGAGLPPLQFGTSGHLDGAALAWKPAARFGPPPPPPRAEGPPEDDPGPPPMDGPGAAGERGGAPFPPPRREGPSPPRGSCELAATAPPGGEGRAARFTTPRTRAVLAQSLAPMKAEMQTDLQRALQLLVPLALALTALGAWLLAALTMRPVNRLRSAMQAVTRLALNQRLASAGEDREFQDLIAAYNTMLARLDASFQQASRFSADAAHELKTPLTILQGRLEQALHQAADSPQQAALSDMLDEVGRLAAITRKLLLLSQADAGQLALHRENVNLAELLETLVADAQMLVTEQRVSGSVQPGLHTRGDALLLRQLFNNLLSNALRYGRPDGWITVSGRQQPGGVEVVFANATAPLDAAQRARFFDRFHRGDSAHNRAVDGHGLGLSLSREIARAHGGDLTLAASADDEVQLRLWLPGGG
jgi:signal transduction histidine kinase